MPLEEHSLYDPQIMLDLHLLSHLHHQSAPLAIEDKRREASDLEHVLTMLHRE